MEMLFSTLISLSNTPAVAPQDNHSTCYTQLPNTVHLIIAVVAVVVAVAVAAAVVVVIVVILVAVIIAIAIILAAAYVQVKSVGLVNRLGVLDNLSLDKKPWWGALASESTPSTLNSQFLTFSNILFLFELGLF